MGIINVKFDVYFKRELGTLFKSNEVDLDGLEANVNLDLELVESMKINYLINGNKLTDDITIKDIEKKLILIPFKSEVRVSGVKIQFEIQANMKNGDVKVSQTYAYDVEMGIGEGTQVGTGGSGDGHTHSNLSTLNKVTESKLREWDNKSNFSGNYNDLTNKPTIPTVDVTKVYVDSEVSKKADKTHSHSEYATPSYVQEKIAEASLSGGEVDLSGYATEEYVNSKVAENTDKITVLNANINGRYTNQQIDEKVSEIVVTKIDGDLVFRDVLVGETFEINEDNVAGPPTVVYGNIVISTTTLSFNENTTTTFTVKLDEAPTNDQVVNLSVNNAYCTLSKTSLTFTSSNYSTVQTVTVAGVHDSSDYSNQTSIINLTSANVANKTISVTIKNVDTPPAVTIPVTGVSLSQPTHTMEVGQTRRLTAAVSPSDATNKNVTWGASNSNATVIDGLVSAKNEGECIITVTTEDGNKTATCQIVIEAKNENDGEHPIDVIPVIDLDVANWDETTTLTDKCGNYHFTIGDVSKYTKLDDGGVFIASSSPARSTFATPGSYSVRIKMKFTQLPGAYGRFWRWENDTPSLYVEAAKQFLTFKAAGSSAQAYRISTTKTYVNELVDVVCCFDGATKEIGMYINGEKVGFQSGTQASGGGNTLTIGNIDTNAYNIDFAMYAFQVYDTALSEDQIRGL